MVFPFKTVVDFGFKEFGCDAEYRKGGVNPPITVSVISNSPDVLSQIERGEMVSESFTLDVRISEIQTVFPGDTFKIGNDIFKVQGEPLRDSQRIVWSVDVVK